VISTGCFSVPTWAPAKGAAQRPRKS